MMRLEPCPFCAHPRANAFYSDDFRQWTVQCDNCPVDIGWYATEAEAVTAWNRRPALAAAVQAEREAILSRLESMQTSALSHGLPDALGLGLACGVVKARGTVTPSISPTIPTVDVLAVVREFIAADDAFCRGLGDDPSKEAEDRWVRAGDALRALVAPRTSGVEDAPTKGEETTR